MLKSFFGRLSSLMRSLQKQKKSTSTFCPSNEIAPVINQSTSNDVCSITQVLKVIMLKLNCELNVFSALCAGPTCENPHLRKIVCLRVRMYVLFLEGGARNLQ